MHDPYRKLRRWLHVFAWILAICITYWLFEGIWQYQHTPKSSVTQSGATKEVIIHGNQRHSFQFRGYINGHPVIFLLDTGASQVSIPLHLADKLGLQAGQRGQAFTANGHINIHYTNIKSLRIGTIELHNVLGHINPGIKRNVVLLGMSALKHLELVQRNNVVILRQYEQTPSAAMISNEPH